MTQTKPMPVSERLVIYRLQRGLTSPIPNTGVYSKEMGLTPRQRRRLMKKWGRLLRGRFGPTHQGAYTPEDF